MEAASRRFLQDENAEGEEEQAVENGEGGEEQAVENAEGGEEQAVENAEGGEEQAVDGSEEEHSSSVDDVEEVVAAPTSDEEDPPEQERPLLPRRPALVSQPVPSPALTRAAARRRLLETPAENEEEQEESESSQVAEIPIERVCAICLVRPKSAGLAPCGHANLCFSCALKLQRTTGKCSYCRTQIRFVMKLYDQ